MNTFWKNLKYYILGLIAMNFIYLYILYSPTPQREIREMHDMNVVREYIQLHEKKTGKKVPTYRNDSISSEANSVVDEIGKTIGKGPDVTSPVPENGKFAELVKTVNENSSATTVPYTLHLKATLAMLLFLITISLIFISLIMKSKTVDKSKVASAETVGDKYYLIVNGEECN